MRRALQLDHFVLTASWRITVGKRHHAKVVICGVVGRRIGIARDSKEAEWEKRA